MAMSQANACELKAALGHVLVRPSQTTCNMTVLMITIDGGTLSYNVSGAGPPIVFVAGLGIMARGGNLSPLHRPPTPSLDRGPIQRRVRRAFIAWGKAVFSTSQLIQWTHPRARGTGHNKRRSVRRDALAIALSWAPMASLIAAGSSSHC
jgi:hypothetical protein